MTKKKYILYLNLFLIKFYFKFKFGNIILFYTRMSQKNTQSLAGYMNGSNSLY